MTPFAINVDGFSLPMVYRRKPRAFKVTRQTRLDWRTARSIAAAHGVNYLLTKLGQNPKVTKNNKVGFITTPLHLAPADLSGFNVCPFATLGCKAACLHSAGNPAYMKSKERARIARTRLYFANREVFMTLLVAEISAHVDRVERMGARAAVRLNATSDIPYERVPVTVNGKRFSSIMAAFPGVVFYDYTKRPIRKDLPSNYHLSFSLADGNDDSALLAIKHGLNVVVVFNINSGSKTALPKYWTLGNVTLPVVDGDEHDFRPIDPKRSFIGLRAKGDARGDQSGFVRVAFTEDKAA